MLKYIYRILILIAVFAAALFYFSQNIREVVFDKNNTTKMENVTFPLVTIKTGDNTINQLHGYSSSLNANTIREGITPLNADQSFEILINEENYKIKKLNYELREKAGNSLVEQGSISVFDQIDKEKAAKIKLNTKLTADKEYAVKIALISSKSDRIYYYLTVKVIDQAFLSEKLQFVMNFHNALKEKNTAREVLKYLEPDPSSDNSSLSKVNIHSSFDLISWGNLKPVFLTEVIPTVKEIYMDTALIELDYYVSADISGANEYFRVKEAYRVRYTPQRMYLLNYERNMEALFDINLASVNKSELKLGITSDNKVPYITTEDKKKLAFVRNNELWFYNLEENKITNVFSFRQDKPDYIRDLYDQHGIQIMNLDAEGNLYFMVYGYMNRGEYEGRVGIILYQYIPSENRIEELVYIPVEEPYQILKENLDDFAYVNSKDVFFFHINNNIYSYNLITKKLKTVAKDIHKDRIVVLKDLNSLVWQENSDPKKSKNINIMNMETEELHTINAKNGYKILLMGTVDSNVIYGFVKEDNIITGRDGKVICPLSSLEIADVNKKILKQYKKSGYYVSDVNVKDNVIELSRVKKDNGDFVSASKDYIMNEVRGEEQPVSVTKRVTTKALTEWYLSLPKDFTMNTRPKVTKTVNTVIAQDTTVRLPIEEKTLTCFYPYVAGGIKGSYEDASDAIKIADEGTGSVLDNSQYMVWERGVKPTTSVVSYFKDLSGEAAAGSSVEACIDLMLRSQGISVNGSKLKTSGSSAFKILTKYSKYTPVNLTGITLDEALYYVAVGRPVIAFTGHKNALLIYGYDSFNIMVIDPVTKTKRKMGIGDSAKLFEKAGNIFISYLE